MALDAASSIYEYEGRTPTANGTDRLFVGGDGGSLGMEARRRLRKEVASNSAAESAAVPRHPGNPCRQ